MRTHIVIGLAVALYFLPHVTDKLIFVPIVLLTSLLPDVDSPNSYFGNRWFSKPVQWIFSHRGPIHSYTLCIALSAVLALFYPVLALPFFLGYSFHLASDSFTVTGIRPFWPLKMQVTGKLKTGGNVERGVFMTMIVVDLFLLFLQFFS